MPREQFEPGAWTQSPDDLPELFGLYRWTSQRLTTPAGSRCEVHEAVSLDQRGTMPSPLAVELSRSIDNQRWT